MLDELHQKVTPLFLTGQRLQASFPIFGLIGYTLVVSDDIMDDLFLFHALRWSWSSSQMTAVIVPFGALKKVEDIQLLAEWFGSKVGGEVRRLIQASGRAVCRDDTGDTEGCGCTGWYHTLKQR